jgi:hypothetical protein
LNSGSGQPVTLLSPRYTCFVPPAPTICPAMSTQTGVHAYTLGFSVPAGTQISLSGTIAAASG